MEHSDQQLLARLKGGDHAAFTEIYNRYWSVLYVHARGMLGEADLARDVVQEVFTGIWQKSAQLELHISLNAYLYKSVRNTILNLIRREKVELGYLADLGHFYQEGIPCTEEQLRFKELHQLIEEGLSQMPPKMREVFDLSRKQYLPHAEIARHLDISEGTVKKQINKALRLLRLKLHLPVTVLLVLLKL
ncbi:RNA polymerase subunit sigma-70 [Pedobacter sp. KBW06]|uniref:RNA polymerase sigma factor n=1 Tax=Pedobacter sp. KBW06 TaxID=2153359 RepID=UPI000F5B1A4E|nr:RNA polymerase sigma-70 factor [Pedobacter sp. KBW06]RQO72177.1 RNA polymerase subunit sigma-70 [Pedobacter sp. KBW06]